jgi:hypothetical protein
MKRIMEDDEEAPLAQEDPVGLKVISHQPIAYTRSGSVDNLTGLALSADVAPRTDFATTWIIKFGNQVTQIQAPESVPVQEMCDRAALELGIGLKKWKSTIDRKGLRIHVNCTSPEPMAIQASIHFGNQEWAGKVNRSSSDKQLIREAQAQLGLEGTWHVRAAATILDVRTIETERIQVQIEKPPLPRGSEVVFDYHGTRRSKKTWDQAWDQARLPLRRGDRKRHTEGTKTKTRVVLG